MTVTAQAALSGPDGIGALVHVVDPVDSLRQTPNDLWAATPVDRMEALLRDNGVEIGIVTDGRWWGLVCAREGSMAASGIVDALTWVEEPRTRDAFLTLIGRQYIIGGDRPSGCRCCSTSPSPPPRRSPKRWAPRSAAPSSC